MSTELDEKQVFVDELEIGMFVTRLDRPWEETEFLLQGFLIETPEDLEALASQCRYVFIERKSRIVKSPPIFGKVERRKQKLGLFARAKKALKKKTASTQSAHLASTAQPQSAPQNKVTYINKVTVDKEFNSAKQSYTYAKLTAKNIMEGIRIGRTIDINECRKAVDQIVDSIIRNSNALVWLSKLKSKDEYTAEHAINVCILSVAFARYLGFEEKEIRKVGLCGLLHDVGKAKIPDEILLKEGRFTDDEFELMKSHSLLGRDLLMTMPDIDLIAIDVAYCHHERPDESGYPRGLKRHQIPYYAMLIAITDAYDAITSSRCYDDGRSSMEALDIIYKNRGRQFDEELALEFIKCIGVYPPGSIVEMTNGEVGIVIATNPEVKLRPRLVIVLDENKNKCHQKVVNLLNNPVDSSGNLYNISSELPNGKFGVDIRQYLKKGLKLSK
ncbi:HD-GYP domain-containing protein [Aliikangiella marina]|uniref:HD-GYP domain-containing protein n=1 Tax=Aliikangiella marina TaxID=1712262 RepID=A0A545TC17_9GAMM|nr:HD-GYP domain-containing protein [Aliikangiella marina]TQV74736.1 HD-GYP domain-containing protein [Aliikangiella marina]